jgi:hypothetical protein
MVTGVLATSDLFMIWGATDVTPAPAALAFAPVRPNPAAGRAVFRFGLPARTRVTLEVYDLLGRRVRTLVDAERSAGWYDLAWSGAVDHGGTAAAGIYFARLRAAGREFHQRLVWLK